MYAEQALLNLEDVLSKISDEKLEEALKQESSDEEIHVYLLPGGNIAVPLLGLEKDQFMTDFVHIRDNKERLQKKIQISIFDKYQDLYLNIFNCM